MSLDGIQAVLIAKLFDKVQERVKSYDLEGEIDNMLDELDELLDGEEYDDDDED